MNNVLPTSTITDKIKNYAKNVCTFTDIGIADVELLTEETSLYSQWLGNGNHGGMQYLAKNIDKREDIRLVLPNAQSVIVCTENYYTPFSHTEDETKGKISRYAWGDDYHTIISTKLQLLSDYVKHLVPDAECRYYVDTGPILEKQWAVKAGIGWQGKNSNIISKQHGSFFFLAVLITTIPLDADKMVLDFCGTCTACISSCPTQAITPYSVDATKCISYWTIEAKKEEIVPNDIRSNLSGWLYGCDICQDVCPWNRFKSATDTHAYYPRNEETSLLLTSVDSMTQEDFSQRFRLSPIKRTKITGLQRTSRALQENKLSHKQTDLS